MAVLVTGASGYIAKYVVHSLLNDDYKVIGTVKTEEQAKHLFKFHKSDPGLSYETVPDLVPAGAFDKVFQKRSGEIDIVLHMALPDPALSDNYAKNLVKPTVAGTWNILEAIRKYGFDTVKRVVITSSALTIVNPFHDYGSRTKFTERDWNPITMNDIGKDMLLAYSAGRKYAESEAWNFLKHNEVKFKLTTILPTCVFGPQVSDEFAKKGLPVPNDVIQSLVHSSPGKELNPDVRMQFVDVRDVARAHLLAFQKEEAANQRLALSSGKFTSQEVVDILNNDFDLLEGKITKGPKPGNHEHNLPVEVDSSHTDKILQIKYKGLEESVFDTASQILRVEGTL